MSKRHDTTDREGQADGQPCPDHVETIELGEEGVVLYDGDNLQAWLQSDRAVPLTEMQ